MATSLSEGDDISNHADDERPTRAGADSSSAVSSTVKEVSR